MNTTNTTYPVSIDVTTYKDKIINDILVCDNVHYNPFNTKFTKTLNCGSSTITVGQTASSIIAWDMTTNATGLTFNLGTANIIITLAGNSLTMTFAGGGSVYNKLSFAGNYAGSVYSITGNNTFSELESLKTQAFTVRFAASSTTTFTTWTLNGTAGNVTTITSPTTTHTLS